MKKTRTIAAQTRIDARDFCVLVEAFPFQNEEEKTLSNIFRFYLESSAEALTKRGAARPLTISDAIQRIEEAGFRLSQLSTKNPESVRTRRAIEKEQMAETLLQLGPAPENPQETLMSELARNVSAALSGE